MLTLISACPALAAPRPRLRIQHCPTSFAQETRRLLAIEVPGLELPDGARMRVAVQCAGESVRVTARDGAGDPVRRALPLAPVARPARARLVALAAAELVAALEGRRARRGSSSPRHAVRRPARPPGRWALTGTATLGTTGSRWSFTSGGALAVDHHPFRYLGWRAGLALQQASSRADLGDTRALLVSGTAAVTVSWPAAWGRIIVGAGGRLGVARLTGEAAAPGDLHEGTVTGAWGGPYAVLDLRFSPEGRMLFSLGVELTYVTLPVTGRVTGEAPFGVDGLLLLGTAGLGLSL